MCSDLIRAHLLCDAGPLFVEMVAVKLHAAHVAGDERMEDTRNLAMLLVYAYFFQVCLFVARSSFFPYCIGLDNVADL